MVHFFLLLPRLSRGLPFVFLYLGICVFVFVCLYLCVCICVFVFVYLYLCSECALLTRGILDAGSSSEIISHLQKSDLRENGKI